MDETHSLVRHLKRDFSASIRNLVGFIVKFLIISQGFQWGTYFLVLSSGVKENPLYWIFVSPYCNVIWYFDMMENTHAI